MITAFLVAMSVVVVLMTIAVAGRPRPRVGWVGLGWCVAALLFAALGAVGCTPGPEPRPAQLIVRSPIVCTLTWVEDGVTLGSSCEVRDRDP